MGINNSKQYSAFGDLDGMVKLFFLIVGLIKGK